ncbi:MAG: hypothetical protein IPK16_25820 [Anaerolineales bacterium]|nr:hypothetical protein [Anaerolineales bacterium]
MDPGARWQAGAINCLVNGKPVSDRDPNADGFQVNVTAGSSVTCSITNTYVPAPGRIVLTKVVSNTNVTNWSFQFTLDGGSVRTATKDAPTVTWEELTPNRTYTLAEVAPGDSWEVGKFICVVGGQPLSDANPEQAGFQANVKPGDEIACRITNTKVSGSALDPAKEPGAFAALIYLPAVTR